MEDEQGEVTVDEYERRVGPSDRRDDPTTIALQMLREQHSEMMQQYIVTREEVSNLRGEVESIKHDRRANQDRCHELEQWARVKIHGEHGDNGLTGRLSACERWIKIVLSIGGPTLAGLAVLTWWAWRGTQGGP